MKVFYFLLATTTITNTNLFAPKFICTDFDKLPIEYFKTKELIELFNSALLGFGLSQEEVDAVINPINMKTIYPNLGYEFTYPESLSNNDNHSYDIEMVICKASKQLCLSMYKRVINGRSFSPWLNPQSDPRLVSTLFLLELINLLIHGDFNFPLGSKNPFYMGLLRALNFFLARIEGGLFCEKFFDRNHECICTEGFAPCIEKIKMMEEKYIKELLLYINPNENFDVDQNNCPVANALNKFRLAIKNPDEFYENFSLPE